MSCLRVVVAAASRLPADHSSLGDRALQDEADLLELGPDLFELTLSTSERLLSPG